MAVVIRLSKTGRKGESRFRVVVCEKRSRRDGKPIEILGWYNKGIKTQTKEIKKERYNYWISKGAKPSLSIENLMNV